MKENEFDACKEQSSYDDFMGYTLSLSGLTMDDYRAFMPKIFDIVVARTEKDPALVYEQVIKDLRNAWTASSQLPFHGPWHHGIVGGIIIATLRNNGHGFDDADVREALKRGLMIPAGGCGFLGICGAAAGLGIAGSIINRATPFHDKERSVALEMSSQAIKMISRLGGPRCCAMSTYATIDIARRDLGPLGFDMEGGSSSGRCADNELNPQCHKEQCPYYPR